MAYEPLNRLPEMLHSFHAAEKLFKQVHRDLPPERVQAVIDAHRDLAPLVQRLHNTQRSLEYLQRKLERIRNADGMS